MRRWKQRTQPMACEKEISSVNTDTDTTQNCVSEGHVKRLAQKFQQNIDEKKDSSNHATFFKSSKQLPQNTYGVRPVVYSTLSAWEKLPIVRQGGESDLIPLESSHTQVDNCIFNAEDPDGDAEIVSDEENEHVSKSPQHVHTTNSSPSRRPPSRATSSPSCREVSPSRLNMEAPRPSADWEYNEAIVNETVQYLKDVSSIPYGPVRNEHGIITHQNLIHPDGTTARRKFSVQERKTFRALTKVGYKLQKSVEFVTLRFGGDFIVMTQPLHFSNANNHILIGHFANLAIGGEMPQEASFKQRVIATGKYMEYLNDSRQGVYSPLPEDPEKSKLRTLKLMEDLKIAKLTAQIKKIENQMEIDQLTLDQHIVNENVKLQTEAKQINGKSENHEDVSAERMEEQHKLNASEVLMTELSLSHPHTQREASSSHNILSVSIQHPPHSLEINNYNSSLDKELTFQHDEDTEKNTNNNMLKLPRRVTFHESAAVSESISPSQREGSRLRSIHKTASNTSMYTVETPASIHEPASPLKPMSMVIRDEYVDCIESPSRMHETPPSNAKLSKKVLM